MGRKKLDLITNLVKMFCYWLESRDHFHINQSHVARTLSRIAESQKKERCFFGFSILRFYTFRIGFCK